MFFVNQYRKRIGLFLLLLALVAAAYWLHQRHDAINRTVNAVPPAPVETNTYIERMTIVPIPLQVAFDPAKAQLGKQLFFDIRLSHNNTISCASCHSPANGGADGKSHSPRFDGSLAPVNTPTVFNAGLRSHQFWDGRVETLEQQTIALINEAHEMGAPWPEIASRLKADEDFMLALGEVYADGLTLKNTANALAEYQRSLITPNARFDRYLRGDQTAINADEKQGYQLFSRYGCVACHQGVNVGGNMFEKMGSIRDYFADREKKHGIKLSLADLGRYNITHNENDRNVFKVCSLRNIAKTAPYFHDGSAETIEDAIAVMSYYNLGLTMPKEDVRLIAAFLRTLTGELEGAPL